MRNFKAKLESSDMPSDSQFNGFWRWKIEVEANSGAHILDHNHISDTCTRLLDILPGWQTYRGVQCDYRTLLPVSLSNISNAYDQIRNYSLLDLDKVPTEALELMWHELGRVKTGSGNRTQLGEYSVIAVCKPLMFMWGQTPPFDSVNRDKMYLFPLGGSWLFKWWKDSLNDLHNELLSDSAVIEYCREKAIELYKSSSLIPYGRFLDVYYYEDRPVVAT